MAHTFVWPAQGGGSRTDATDIICPMYARIDECISFANIPTEHRPVIQCEYAHAMGNSNGNYKVYKICCLHHISVTLVLIFTHHLLPESLLLCEMHPQEISQLVTTED